ncbi:DUF5993 family protein [Candidatus Fukatsuia symbiotica]|uniref:DUF5993 family protein n=2 Tax=Yersiniaceae TaxID=1903411 RepID=UPI0013C332DA|nr:DUF5993 family protein [Candidatus Fukatsuia symbiotica]
MMALPFLFYAGGLVFILNGKRRAALFFWLIATVLTLVLFRLHTSGSLNVPL